MKIKAGKIGEIVQALSVVMSKDMPINERTLELSRISTTLKTEFQSYENHRMLLVEKYAQTDEEGRLITDPEGKEYLITDIDGFRAEYDKISNAEITVDHDLVPVEIFGDVTVPGVVIEALQDIIERK